MGGLSISCDSFDKRSIYQLLSARGEGGEGGERVECRHLDIVRGEPADQTTVFLFGQLLGF